MAGMASPPGGTAFEPFMAVAVANYDSDKDEILSFEAGQEILITGEAPGDAAALWWLGQISSEEAGTGGFFVRKEKVVKKKSYTQESDESASRHKGQEELQLQRLLELVKLDGQKWMKLLADEEITSVEDLDEVLLEGEDAFDFGGQLKLAEKIKMRKLREMAIEKAKLREWISNAGLDVRIWYPIFLKADVTSMTELMDVSDRAAKAILAKVRNKREQLALERLLNLDLSGDGDREIKCLRGCGVKVKSSEMGEHDCILTLRRHLEILKEHYVPLVTVTDLATYNGSFRASNVLTLSLQEISSPVANYWIAPDGHVGPGFLYELPTTVRVTGVSLKNTQNGTYSNLCRRGTYKYSLRASLDGENFSHIHEGTLPNLQNKFKDSPVVFVKLDVRAKVIRFDCGDNRWGNGPGLHYFRVHWEFD